MAEPAAVGCGLAIGKATASGAAGGFSSEVLKQSFLYPRNRNNNKKEGKKIEEAIGKVLGPGAWMARDSYVSSPLLNFMKERCQASGTVYIAHVPNGMGKTTACNGFMKLYARNLGLAFCPSDDARTLDGTSYGDLMLGCLQLSTSKPPNGWVGFLIETLLDAREKRHNALAKEKKTLQPYNCYLLVDDFMSEGRKENDERLLKLIKTTIRDKPIIVIVLTGNESSANACLIFNGLNSIVPMVTRPQLRGIKQRHLKKDKDKNWLPIQLDWDNYLSMSWSDDAFYEAVLSKPKYMVLNDAEKEILKREIDTYLTSLTLDERKELNVTSLLQELADPMNKALETWDSVPEEGSLVSAFNCSGCCIS